jgi:hypothetical protein
VKLDIGVIQDGWVGDTATTVPVGMIDERTERLLRVTERALGAPLEWLHRRRSGWATFARRLRRKRRAGFSMSCANLSGTAWDENCTKNRRFRITESVGAGRG